MNEEPKARSSINLDELERQLREASRNQAFRVSDPEKFVVQRPVDRTTDYSVTSDERSDFRAGSGWTNDPSEIDQQTENDASQLYSTNERADQVPPPFLTGPREGRFPDVGAIPDMVNQGRSWRSIFLVAFLTVLIVSGGYAYLYMSRTNSLSTELSDVPVIKADTNPTRVKPEASAPESSSPAGSELFTRQQSDDEKPAVVISTKEQPVDLRASGEVVPEADQSDATLSVSPGNSTANSAISAPDTASKPQTPALAPVKSVRTVTVRADGSIIDPSGILDSGAAPSSATIPPAEPLSSSPLIPSAAADQKTEAVDLAPTSNIQQLTLVSVPLPPIRPSDADPEGILTDPLAEVSGLLAETPQATITESGTDPAPSGSIQPLSGLFSVQFGAPATDAEARALVDRVKVRLGDAVEGREMGIFKGENSGKTVFRVRVVNVERADGQALCDAYLAQGGQCFVTRN